MGWGFPEGSERARGDMSNPRGGNPTNGSEAPCVVLLLPGSSDDLDANDLATAAIHNLSLCVDVLASAEYPGKL